MAQFHFDPLTRSHSAVNALTLARASNLAYEKTAVIENTIRNEWGFSDFLYLDDRSTDTQAFVAGNNQMVLVAFRGTQATNPDDWMTDLHVKLVRGPAGKVHDGFLGALGGVWRKVIQFARNERGSRALWVTGHSLGAALATLAVAKLRLEFIEPVNGLTAVQIS